MHVRKVTTFIFILLLFNGSPVRSQFKIDKIGDMDTEITLPSDVKPADFAYLDGFFWVGDINTQNIYKISPTTGAEVLRFNIGFSAGGVTTDGTYLYVSVYDFGTPNGTIFKFQTDGTQIDKMDIPIYNNNFLGLAFGNEKIWASQVLPNRIVSIDPATKSIASNLTIDNINFGGLAYLEGVIWGVAYFDDLVYKIDPLTGKTIDLFPGLTSVGGDWGIATDGTSIFTSEFGTENYIRKLKLEAAITEIYNTYSISPVSFLRDIAYRAGLVYLLDGADVQILDAGNYSKIDSFTLSVVPRGITTDGTNIFIANGSWGIDKYTMGGTYVGGIIKLPDLINALTFDGSNIWAVTTGADDRLYKIGIDGSILANYTTVSNSYTGIVYVESQNAIWAYDFTGDKIIQLNDNDGTPTGIEIDMSATTINEWGLAFDGNHLLAVDRTNAAIHKIQIDLSKPFIKISNPTDKEEVFGETSIDIITGDNETSVVKVDIFIDGENVTSLTSTPFTYSWTETVEGDYDIQVKGYDEYNNMAFDEVTVTVKDPSKSSSTSNTDSSSTTQSEDGDEELFGYPRNQVIIAGVVVLVLLVLILRSKGKKKK